MKTIMKRLWKDEDGASAIEYGLIAAGIAVVIGVTAASVGTQLNVVFERIVTALTPT